MIKFAGFKKIDKVDFLLFQIESGEIVQIPVEEPVRQRIVAYLNKISKNGEAEYLQD